MRLPYLADPAKSFCEESCEWQIGAHCDTLTLSLLSYSRACHIDDDTNISSRLALHSSDPPNQSSTGTATHERIGSSGVQQHSTGICIDKLRAPGLKCALSRPTIAYLTTLWHSQLEKSAPKPHSLKE